MLQSLISLSEADIERVTDAVRQWCSLNHAEIDRADGRRALTVAIELVQSKHASECIAPELTRRLARQTGFMVKPSP